MRSLLLAAAAAAAIALLPAALATAAERAPGSSELSSDEVLPGTHAVPTISLSGYFDPWASAALPSGSITEPGVEVAYQWVRVSGDQVSAIDGATSADYHLTPADAAYRLAVRVTVAKPGFETLELQSVDRDPAVHVPSIPEIVGPDGFSVGDRIHVPDFGAENDGAAVGTMVTYQWLRNGAEISGGYYADYDVVLADLGARLSVRMTVYANGLVPANLTAALTAPVGLGTIPFGRPPTVIANGPSAPGKYFTLFLDTRFYEGAPGFKMSVAWLRDGKVVPPLSKYNPADYQLTSADAGHKIWARITVNQTGYQTLVFSTEPHDYTLKLVKKPVIVGNPVPGQELWFSDPIEISREPEPGYNPVLFSSPVTWYRNGVPVPDSDSYSYTVTAADLGKTISFGFVVREAGFIGTSYRSPSTQVIRANLFAGYDTPVTVTQSGLKLTATPGVTTPGTTFTYRWYRGSAAISGATRSSYTLTSADAGKTIKVRVTAVKTNYTTLVRYSAATNYSVQQDTAPTVTAAAFRVGEVVSVSLPSYSTKDGTITPTLSYQWYRSGAAIKGAVSPTYAIASADYGKKLTVRVVARASGYLSLVSTTAATPAVAKGVTVGTPTVSVTVGSGVLSAGITPGTLVPATPTPAVSFQWLRDGAPITGATLSTYRPTAADWDKQISVRLVLSRSNFSVTRITITSSPSKYSVRASGTPAHIEGADPTFRVDYPVTVRPEPVHTNDAGDPIYPTYSYQWLRNGVTIPGAVAQRYRPTPADVGRTLSVRVTTSAPGLAPYVVVVGPVGPGVTSELGTLHPRADMIDTFSRTLAAKIDDEPTMLGPEVGFTHVYQWYRRHDASSPWTKIVGATKQKYVLTDADYDAFVSVQVNVSRPGWTGFTQSVADLDPGKNWSWLVVAPAKLSPADPVVGTRVYADFPAYVDAISGETPTINALNCGWTWYRNGAVITGAYGQSYTPVVADVGRLLSVRISCYNYDGRIQPPVTAVAASTVASSTSG